MFLIFILIFLYKLHCILYTCILILGDLVDARTKDLLGSKQFEKEWEWYQQILNETGVTNNTIWLDIRGNHGNIIYFMLQTNFIFTMFIERKKVVV